MDNGFITLLFDKLLHIWQYSKIANKSQAVIEIFDKKPH